MLNFSFYLTVTLFIIVCLFMILLVLIQKGRGGGLASAFGGAGANTAFGSKTGDVLTWATSIVFGIFLILAISLNLMANQITANRAARPATATPPPAAVEPISGAPVGGSTTQPVAPPATNIAPAPASTSNQ